MQAARVVERVHLAKLSGEVERLRETVVLVLFFSDIEQQRGQITEASDKFTVVTCVLVSFPGAVIFQDQVGYDPLRLHVLKQLAPLLELRHIESRVRAAVLLGLFRGIAEPGPNVVVVAANVMDHHVERVDSTRCQIINRGLAFFRGVEVRGLAQEVLRIVTASLQPIGSITKLQVADMVLRRTDGFQASPLPEALLIRRALGDLETT